MDSDSEPELRSLTSQLLDPDNTKSEAISLTVQIVSLVIAMDLDSKPKPETELMSFVSQAVSIFNSMDLDSQPEPLLKLIHFFSHNTYLENSTHSESELESFFSESLSLDPKPELLLFISKTLNLLMPRQPKTESKLIKRIAKLTCHDVTKIDNEVILRIIRIIDAVSSMDLDSQPKPESKLMSLVSQAISVFNSMDMDTQPEPLSELISLIYQILSQDISPYGYRYLLQSLFERTLDLKPEPELISLIHQILSLGSSKSSRWKDFISVCSHVQLKFKEGQVYEEVIVRTKNNENHEEYKQAPVDIKHPLHPKHSLQLVLVEPSSGRDSDRDRDRDRDGRRCYCCDRDIEGAIYYCSACDFAINFSCVEKTPVLLLSIDHPKWHEHTLALFSRTTSLTCDLCSLVDSTCPLYICPPCGFVAHQRCLSLPRVIRISRHLHRLSFTHSFDRGDWSCGVCRTKIDNDYGGYTCTKDGCSYAAHSKCATQSNVWDGVDLEGVPEETEEELEPPFLRIGDGIIQHFGHFHHHLRLDENTGRDYDENNLCEACVTPIHYGNFYYCMYCDDFILHEKCANLSRKIYNPIHPHLLTLVTDDIGIVEKKFRCSACPWMCTGFFYECRNESCRFKLHIQCATVAEPLDHESHRHPLFLTSKPGEKRRCGVCNDSRRPSIGHGLTSTDETFNCVERCDFSLCFACATLPQKVRYKHDKHMLTLSYGEETHTMAYWCEACEKKINVKERFYKCDEYCCVTLHIECLVENGLYMKPDLLLEAPRAYITVQANNHRMSRPFCYSCGDGKRCPYRFYFTNGYNGNQYCSITCYESH